MDARVSCLLLGGGELAALTRPQECSSFDPHDPLEPLCSERHSARQHHIRPVGDVLWPVGDRHFRRGLSVHPHPPPLSPTDRGFPVITRYESVLRVQQYVFIGYIGVWVVVLVFGIVGLACAEVTLEWRTVQWGKVRSKARGWWERLKGLGRGAKGTSRRDRGRRRSESARRSSRSGSDSDGSEMALRKSGR